jgi:hypothetical protein
MIKRNVQQQPSAESPVAARLAEIRRHRAELRARDQDLAAQDRLIPMTTAPVAPVKHPAGYESWQTMVNGFAPVAAIGGTDGERRHRIQFERGEIGKADEFLRRREIEARADLIAEAMRRTADDWQRITRARAVAILQLRDANRRARAFREALAAQAGGVDFSLPADRVHPLFSDPPKVGDVFYEFLADAVQLGVITEREVRDAS